MRSTTQCSERLKCEASARGEDPDLYSVYNLNGRYSSYSKLKSFSCCVYVVPDREACCLSEQNSIVPGGCDRGATETAGGRECKEVGMLVRVAMFVLSLHVKCQSVRRRWELRDNLVGIQ